MQKITAISRSIKPIIRINKSYNVVMKRYQSKIPIVGNKSNLKNHSVVHWSIENPDIVTRKDLHNLRRFFRSRSFRKIKFNGDPQILRELFCRHPRCKFDVRATLFLIPRQTVNIWYFAQKWRAGKIAFSKFRPLVGENEQTLFKHLRKINQKGFHKNISSLPIIFNISEPEERNYLIKRIAKILNTYPDSRMKEFLNIRLAFAFGMFTRREYYTLLASYKNLEDCIEHDYRRCHVWLKGKQIVFLNAELCAASSIIQKIPESLPKKISILISETNKTLDMLLECRNISKLYLYGVFTSSHVQDLISFLEMIIEKKQTPPKKLILSCSIFKFFGQFRELCQLIRLAGIDDVEFRYDNQERASAFDFMRNWQSTEKPRYIAFFLAKMLIGDARANVPSTKTSRRSLTFDFSKGPWFPACDLAEAFLVILKLIKRKNPTAFFENFEFNIMVPPCNKLKGEDYFSDYRFMQDAYPLKVSLIGDIVFEKGNFAAFLKKGPHGIRIGGFYPIVKIPCYILYNHKIAKLLVNHRPFNLQIKVFHRDDNQECACAKFKKYGIPICEPFLKFLSCFTDSFG